MSEILERRWLNEAEKGVIFVAGRVDQVGLGAGTSVESKAAPNKSAYGSLDGHNGAWRPPAPRIQDLIIADKKNKIYDDGTPLPPPMSPLQPWPAISRAIPLARHHLLTGTVPPMQALAQKLLIQGLSTVSLSSAVSALAYISLSTTTLYEAGAVAALGLVWAARGVQKEWETARKGWAGEVREEGRQALRETESAVRAVIADCGRPIVDSVGEEDRKKAQAAIDRVSDAAKQAFDATPRSGDEPA